MNPVVKLLFRRSPVQFFTQDLDYHLIRGSMVLIFVLFGYQKWFEYEAQVLIPYISNGPLISWLYPAFGIRGGSWFLGVAEWLFAVPLLLRFWNSKLGTLGALGSVATFVATVTIIPFMPNGWEASAGGFPAMAPDTVAFLMKDVVLLATASRLPAETGCVASIQGRDFELRDDTPHQGIDTSRPVCKGPGLPPATRLDDHRIFVLRVYKVV